MNLNQTLAVLDLSAGGPGSGRKPTTGKQKATHKVLSNNGIKMTPIPWAPTMTGVTHYGGFVSPGTEKEKWPFQHEIFTHPNGSWVHQEPSHPIINRGRISYKEVPGSSGKTYRGKDAKSLAIHLSTFKTSHGLSKLTNYSHEDFQNKVSRNS